MRPALSYVVNSLDPGGTERLVVEMSLAFARDYRVQVLCLDVPGAWAGELRSKGIAVHCLWRQPGLDLAMPWRLMRHFQRHGTDIVHAHQCTPWFYSALARLFCRHPKLLLEEHGRFYPEVESRSRFLVNRVLIRRLTHRFVAVSKDIRARLVRYEGLIAKDIDVIYNGVASERPLTAHERATSRRELGFGPDDFVAGTVGRLDQIKNLPMFVRSLVAAEEVNPSLRGLLVGDGPEMSHIRSLVENSPMRDRIRLTGYRRDARRLVQCMDLFVLSSFSEGTSMALLESLAVGVPAAVTQVGGNPEVVLDGVTGWTVPSDAHEQLCHVLLAAAQDGGRRLQLGQAARARFEEYFSMDRMIENYRGLYRELLPQATSTATCAGDISSPRELP